MKQYFLHAKGTGTSHHIPDIMVLRDIGENQIALGFGLGFRNGFRHLRFGTRNGPKNWKYIKSGTIPFLALVTTFL